MLVSLEEAKTYLRVDSSDDDDLIDILLKSARQLCADVARLSSREADEIENGGQCFMDGGVVDEGRYEEELRSARNTMRIAELYALGYLYEHREEADHHDLTLMLRNLLFSVREGRMNEDREIEREGDLSKKCHGCG